MAIASDVIDALNRSGARYVIVGGVAAVLHGLNRFTADLDVVLDLDSARSTELAVAALTALGFLPNVPVDPKDLAVAEKRNGWIAEKNARVLSFRHPAHPTFAVDVFLESPIALDGLYTSSKVVPLGEISARVCSIAHLIELKRIAGRAQDLLDIEALTMIAERRRER